ncbi:MAG: hypothetical protein R3D83_03930 [Caenibius sp.]
MHDLLAIRKGLAAISSPLRSARQGAMSVGIPAALKPGVRIWDSNLQQA